MPQPLSMTCIRVRPASCILTVTWSAPASTAFSMSSFTTEAGLCTTSPAAIMFATLLGSILISMLFAKSAEKNRIILDYQHDDCSKEKHGNHSYPPLVLADILCL